MSGNGVVFIGLMANHLLDLLGIIYIVTVAMKIALKKPIKRWFW